MESEEYNAALITAEGITALLSFLPYFESSAHFGDYATMDDQGSMGCSVLSDTALAFYEAAYAGHFVQPFDWNTWAHENGELVSTGEGIEDLDLEGLGKLLTAHIRNDRFCDGHLLQMMEQGYIARILRRLNTLDTAR